MYKVSKVALLVGLVSIITACSGFQVDNVAGRATAYVPTNTTGPVTGLGIESQDIDAMTAKMMRSMLANPILAGKANPPRVIIDNSNFRNESSSIVNIKLITNKLRVSLGNAANGRMVFVGRHAAAMVAKERELKRSGMVDGGTIRKTQAQAGADYKLFGEIISQDSMQMGSQLRTRLNQITFEMLDTELGTIVWSGMYEFKKASQDSGINR